MRDRLSVPSFPLPGLEQYDLLYDKWEFARLCETLGIRHPRTWRFDDRDALRRAIAAGEITFPLIVKPLNQHASDGIVKLLEPHHIEAIAKIDYAPVLVQKFIEGADIGTSIFCESGTIRAFIAHDLTDKVYSTFFDREILDTVTRIAAHLRLTGVYNFDMIRSSDGRIDYLECNPRFFMKIAMSMIAGVNFVDAGLGNAEAYPMGPVGHVKLPMALARSLTTPSRISAADFRMLVRTLDDPLVVARRRLRLERL